MQRIIRLSAAIVATLAIGSAAVAAAPDAQIADYSVYLDKPTGFVFVKLPQGWKFAGKVEASALTALPATVLTQLPLADIDAPASAAVAQR